MIRYAIKEANTETLAWMNTGIKQMQDFIQQFTKKSTELDAAQSETSGDAGYSDDRGAQNSPPRTAFEGAWPEDFGYPENPTKLRDYYETLFYDFVPPKGWTFSAEDISESNDLTEQFAAAYLKPFNYLTDEVDAGSLLVSWANAGGSADNDPASYARDVSDMLYDAVNIADGSLKEMQSILKNYQNESSREANWTTEGGKSVMDIHTFSKHVVGYTRKAVDTLSQATGTRAETEIKHVLKVLKSAAKQAEALPGTLPEDYAALQSAVDELKEISTRHHNDDIRSWSTHAVQREDAKLVIGKVYAHWSKTLAGLEKGEGYNANRKAAKDAFIPNYRYKVGEMVYITGSRRFGKVIGASKEGGTGRQLYEIRMDGADRPKMCYLGDLRRDKPAKGVKTRFMVGEICDYSELDNSAYTRVDREHEVNDYLNEAGIPNGGWQMIMVKQQSGTITEIWTPTTNGLSPIAFERVF